MVNFVSTSAASDLLYLSHSQVTTSVAGGSGTGGNITIDPVFIVLDSSDIIANAYEGSGGNISLSTQYYDAKKCSFGFHSVSFPLHRASSSVPYPNRQGGCRAPW